MLRFFVFFAVCVFTSSATTIAENVSNIKLLHVVFRHGERAPVDTYPTDPYINFTFPPYGWGHLTKEGRIRQFQSGEFLRKRYDQFLGEIYHPDVVAVETTGADRAIMSAQLQMSGMWPKVLRTPNDSAMSPYTQPITMQVDPLDKDKLLLVRIPCAPYNMELEAVLRSEYVQNELAPYKDMMEFLEAQTLKQIRTADDVADLYSTLNAEVTYGLELPEWLNGTFPDRMEYLTSLSFMLNVRTPLLKRIKGGPLLKKVLEDSKKAVTNSLIPAGRKLYLYAGHDSTIVNLLSILGVWESQVPEYGIMVMIEVHEHPKTQEYGLKVFLRNSTLSDLVYPLELPQCGYFCPLGTVEELYNDILPYDVEEECKSKDPNWVPPPPKGP